MNILIVESAAKARTLQRYLADDWSVLATGGHVETLPEDRKLHGKDAGKAFWANRPGQLPSPPWVWTERGEEAVRRIVEAAEGEDATFWIATDPDREGEFIAWSLDRRLGERGPTRRVAFQEVTKEAVEAAITQPRDVDVRMVESAIVRKFLDRLVGYRTSKLANTIIPGGRASMGRVQTPTLGFVVERELEREAHVPIPYFEVHALAHGVDLEVRFHDRDDPEAWRDESGRFDRKRTFDGDVARRAADALAAAGVVSVTGARTRERTSNPGAPLSTDTLLQAGGSRFGWSPRKTSALASLLYENGHITYIRTDSTRLAASAVKALRDAVTSQWGDEHLAPATRAQNVATGPTQDAHEAIRPTRVEIEEPDIDDDDARRLYRLIRAHTLASQMAPARRTSVSIDAACEGLGRPLGGSVSWRTFAGWEAAYAEFMGDVATEPPTFPLEPGAVWSLDAPADEKPNPRLIEDETKPPPRYRPHTLVKAMKDAGIGRPSTYSSTVDKLEQREYVVLEDGALAPTPRGRAAWLDAAPLYADDEQPDAELFSAQFTAEMEERLDRIARGDAPAPASWEEWRDRIRALHEAAKSHRARGGATAHQKQTLERLIANAPDDVRAELTPSDDLSYLEAHDQIQLLRDRGVQPAPTDKQRGYIEQLIADLALGEDELEELIGVRDPADIRTSTAASDAIDELRREFDARKPPSAKQRRFVDDLVRQTGVSEAEAAAMVGVESIDELTGGPEGTASALIDRLQAVLAERKAG